MIAETQMDPDMTQRDPSLDLRACREEFTRLQQQQGIIFSGQDITTRKIDCAKKNFAIGTIHNNVIYHLITMISIIHGILLNHFRDALRCNC